ncbi:indoleacetic acid-induced protein 16 [Wolffia australiana]
MEEMGRAREMTMAVVETELRLGIPGAEMKAGRGAGKRVFSETIGLKLQFSAADDRSGSAASSAEEKMNNLAAKNTDMPSAPRGEVVGWPPVRSFRKNILSAHTAKGGTRKNNEDVEAPPPSILPTALVKVSMDGAPYMRKVDLKNYRTYEELSSALHLLFGSFSNPENRRDDVRPGEWKDVTTERKKTMELLTGSDYVPTYEDKDGDWMLVGDVPWKMFISSCKRLRIMRRSEAVGLANHSVSFSTQRKR